MHCLKCQEKLPGSRHSDSAPSCDDAAVGVSPESVLLERMRSSSTAGSLFRHIVELRELFRRRRQQRKQRESGGDSSNGRVGARACTDGASAVVDGTAGSESFAAAGGESVDMPDPVPGGTGGDQNSGAVHTQSTDQPQLQWEKGLNAAPSLAESTGNRQEGRASGPGSSCDRSAALVAAFGIAEHVMEQERNHSSVVRTYWFLQHLQLIEAMLAAHKSNKAETQAGVAERGKSAARAARHGSLHFPLTAFVGMPSDFPKAFKVVGDAGNAQQGVAKLTSGGSAAPFAVRLCGIAHIKRLQLGGSWTVQLSQSFFDVWEHSQDEDSTVLRDPCALLDKCRTIHSEFHTLHVCHATVCRCSDMCNVQCFVFMTCRMTVDSYVAESLGRGRRRSRANASMNKVFRSDM